MLDAFIFLAVFWGLIFAVRGLWAIACMWYEEIERGWK